MLAFAPARTSSSKARSLISKRENKARFPSPYSARGRRSSHPQIPGNRTSPIGFALISAISDKSAPKILDTGRYTELRERVSSLASDVSRWCSALSSGSRRRLRAGIGVRKELLRCSESGWTSGEALGRRLVPRRLMAATAAWIHTKKGRGLKTPTFIRQFIPNRSAEVSLVPRSILYSEFSILSASPFCLLGLLLLGSTSAVRTYSLPRHDLQSPVSPCLGCPG